MAIRQLHVLLLVGAISGCDCGGGIETVHGELVLEGLTDGQSVDFGPVRFGMSEERTLLVRNHGRGPLHVEALDADEQAPPGNAAAFGLPSTMAWSVPPGGVETVRFSFSPPKEREAEGRYRDYELQLRLKVNGGAPGTAEHALRLRGRGVRAACDVPEVLDFHSVQVGQSQTLGFELHNPLAVPAQVRLGVPDSSSGGPSAFTLSPHSPSGNFTLAPGERVQVSVDFRPTIAGAHLAFLRVLGSSDCPERFVMLQGRGVEAVVTWQPETVECGPIPLGLEARRAVRFTNAGVESVEVRALAVDGAGFSLPDAAPLLLAGAGGTAEVSVACAPTSLGPTSGRLDFQLSLAGQPSGQVPLRAFGGGPDIDVTPTQLSFGRVAFVPEAAGQVSSRRRLFVRNLGSHSEDASGNLRLGRIAEDGSSHPPLVEVLTPDGMAPSSDFQVEVPSNYHVDVGLPASSGENTLALAVTVTPAAEGELRALLRIHSNDVDEPTVEVPVGASAEALTPCRYSVAPAQLQYGLLPPGASRTLAVRFTNLGHLPHEVCLLSGLQLTTDTHPAYALAASWQEREVAPGETLDIPVTIALEGGSAAAALLTGEVSFLVSSPTAPEVRIPLTASAQPSCLHVLPGTLDFGSVQVGCGSALRTTHLYNVCSTPLVLTGLHASAGGLVAGSGDCLGPQDCPAFSLAPGAPIVGTEIPPGGVPVAIPLQFRPPVLGEAWGSLDVTASDDSGATFQHVVPLMGTGAANSLRTDTFTSSPTRKIDLLFGFARHSRGPLFAQTVLDSVQGLLTSALDADVDFHLGVFDATYPGFPLDPERFGRLLRGPSHPEAFLTPTTPGLREKTADKVRDAIFAQNGFETCFHPALTALTPPMSTGANAGFLRPDASLVLVYSHYAGEVSFLDGRYLAPVSYYADALVELKGGRPEGFRFLALFPEESTPTWPQCADSATDAEEIGRVTEMVARTHGQTLNLCGVGEGQGLQELAAEAFAPQRHFRLSAPWEPERGALEVRLDGVPVPATNAQDEVAWSFDADSNTLIFSPDAAPGPGMALTVTYPSGCY